MVIESPPRSPSQDELDDLIPEARDRQRRRRLLGAAAVAISAAIALGVYALAAGGKRGNSPSSSRPESNGAATTCRAPQLATSIAFNGALGLGGASGAATIRNASGTTCSLPNSVPAVQISYRGKPRPLHQTVLRPPDHTPVRLLRPGATAQIWLVWENWCASPHHPVTEGGYPLRQPRVTFTFRLGHAVTITAPHVGAVTCLAPGGTSTLMASRPVTG